MQMQKKYLAFYFEGREDELDLDELDIEALADQITESGDDPRAAVDKAIAKLLAPLDVAREKKEFAEDFKEAIDEVKDGNANDAYAHYLKGRGDAATDDVTTEILEIMDPREEEGEDDEDEDSEDGDGEEDDDEDD